MMQPFRIPHTQSMIAKSSLGGGSTLRLAENLDANRTIIARAVRKDYAATRRVEGAIPVKRREAALFRKTEIYVKGHNFGYPWQMARQCRFGGKYPASCPLSLLQSVAPMNW